jgi:tetratricopeptide (TPR) repeat protein
MRSIKLPAGSTVIVCRCSRNAVSTQTRVPWHRLARLTSGLHFPHRRLILCSPDDARAPPDRRPTQGISSLRYLFEEYAFDTARDMADRAVALKPNSDLAWQERGFTYQLAGQPEEAIRSFERAIRLSPFGPAPFLKFTGMDTAFIGVGRFDDAVAAAKNALSKNRTVTGAYRCLAAALAHLGRDAEARNAAAQLLEIEPHFRISEWVDRSGQRRAQMFIDGLRKAGLPE